MDMGRAVIVGGARTPIGKLGEVYGPFQPLILAVLPLQKH